MASGDESKGWGSGMERSGDTAGMRDTVVRTRAIATAPVTEATQEQALLQALARAEAGLTLEPDAAMGEEHLLFWLGETPCLVRLAELREVLPSLPPHVALPFSPAWLWGVFPLRTELVALVDPTPTLLHGPEVARHMANASTWRTGPVSGVGQAPAPRALVVGEGDHLLALVADRIGDICLLCADDQQAPDQTGTAGADPLPVYVAGAYQIAGLARPALTLRIAQLSDDIFAAIEERPAHE
jgi:chemotaxis signal transduction protein